MYNTERKERFIEYKLETSTAHRNYWMALFNISEPFENELGKDLCDFNEAEFISLYKQMGFSTENYAINTASKMSSYVDWCIKHGYVADGINHFTSVYHQAIEQGINFNKANLYVDKETILKLVRNAAQANPMDGFVLLATYEGIAKDNWSDLLNLKIEDFTEEDGKHYVKLSSGKTVRVSAELALYAEDANNAEYMYSYNRYGIRKIPYAPSPYIIRTIQNVKVRTQDRYVFLTRAVMRALKCSNVEKQISRSTLVASGRVTYIKEQCEEKGITPFEYVNSEECRAEFGERFGVKALKWKMLELYEKYKEHLEK